MAFGAERRRGVQTGKLDVGRLFQDTKKVYLDTRAKAAELGQPNLRVARMYAIMDVIGNLLNEIIPLRSEITRGEEGLAGFDDDLAGVRQRYRNVYWPFFREPEPPSPEEWTTEQWEDFEERIEGPILFWDRETCEQRWTMHAVAPPCEGPDLLTTLSLLHQTGAALELQQDLIASWYGFADYAMEDFLEFYGDIARATGKAIAGGFASIGEGIKDYVVGGGKNGGGFAWGFGLAVVAGIGGYAWLSKKKGDK